MGATSHDKSTLREELRKVFEKARMPTSPVVATRILGLIDDPDSCATQFADVIQADPALSVRLLKMTNTVRYAQREPVTTIQRAVTVLGLRQLRIAALGFELVSHLDRLGGVPFDLPAFWQQCVLRACLAREVARLVVPDLAEEAFLVGLLQDCGVLLLVQVLGHDYADLCRHERLTCTAFYAEERVSFPFTHLDAVEALADMWQLPKTIAEPMRNHHMRVTLGGKSPAVLKLSAVAYFVGAIGFVLEGAAFQAELELRDYARKELRLSEKDLATCFTEAARIYASMSELFCQSPPAGRGVAELLLEANRQLQAQAAKLEQRAHDVEAERDEILGEQQTLRNALGQYREKAARDPLTGLLNRRALVDLANETLNEAEQEGASVLVMFLDLDDFKKVNDTLGHLMGDAVLRAVGQRVAEAVRELGFAGRYGGEEFIAVVPGLDEPAARDLADGLVERLRGTTISGVDLGRPITGSVGAVWCPRPGALSAESIIAGADEAMYQAKRAGKDRSTFRVLSPSDDADAATVAVGNRRISLGADAPIVAETEDDYRRVAERLERDSGGWTLNDRKQHRRSLFAPCDIRVFTGPGRTLRCEQAYVRNLSSGGAGLLIRNRMMRGDLIEIVLDFNGSRWHLAGMVAFCKYIDVNVHALGAQLFQRSERPIFVEDYDEVVRRLTWLEADLLPEPGGADTGRRSA